ncbi:hypothetical protein HK405_006174 [Cladochytrium tenue]|nr:hypothetical protein HK405_006174 [Cladochytrium tenue]
MDLDAARWSDDLARYPEALRRVADRRRNGERLLELDTWFYNTLPQAVAERGHMVRDDLVRIMDYKLLRGTFRPGLTQKVASNDDETVQTVTREVVRRLGDASGPPDADTIAWCVAALDKGLDGKGGRGGGLCGVGPATALIVLAALTDSVPYFSDEAARFVSSGKARVAYDTRTCVSLVAGAREEAGRLGAGWTARDVEKAIYARANHEDTGARGSDKPEQEKGPVAVGGKRRAAAVGEGSKRKRRK